jgi:hypothetical protein
MTWQNVYFVSRECEPVHLFCVAMLVVVVVVQLKACRLLWLSAPVQYLSSCSMTYLVLYLKVRNNNSKLRGEHKIAFNIK